MFWFGMFLVLFASGCLLMRDIRYVIAVGGQLIAVLFISLGLMMMAMSWTSTIGPISIGPQVIQSGEF